MTNEEVYPYFQNRITQLQQEKEELSSRVNLLSFLRFFLFLLFLVGVVYMANIRLFTPVPFLVFFFVLIFGTIVRIHLKAKFKLSQFEYLIQLNEEELLRQKGQLHDLPSGKNLLDTNHPYAPDLDIFGSNSLYQLLVRSRLSGTRKVLTHWMLNGASKIEILERHEAIKELIPDHEWRQEISALGMTSQKKDEDGSSIENLVSWLNDHLHFVDKSIWGILEIVMPLFAATLVFGFWLGDWPYQLFFIPIVINLFLLKIIFAPLMSLSQSFEGIHHLLEGYGHIIHKIENREFKSTFLQRQFHSLHTKDKSASKAIRQLGNILHFHQNRINQIYIPLNILFLLDLIIFRRTLSWKKKYEKNLKQWLDAVHQIDAIADLSSYAFANPSTTYPQIKDEPHFILTNEMGHPLIKKEQRISNDFHLENKGQLALITGSNMSGKSTFLRTLGVNIVLAQMGAPVCAKNFEISLMQVFTSMRTQDNLEENVSSFYAELKRIKFLLDSLNQEVPVFYMLDEILKGTNSDDRHKGAISLIDQVTHQNCMGMISTHDIQLADLSKDNPRIKNYSFNNTIQGDEIIFDYKLTNGPCKSFNASKLMEKMGIIKKSV